MCCDGGKGLNLWHFTPFWSEVPSTPPTSLFRSIFTVTCNESGASHVACGDKDVKMGVKRDIRPFFFPCIMRRASTIRIGLNT
jgi:hypothetical protein